MMNFNRLDLIGYLVEGDVIYNCKLILQDGIVHRSILLKSVQGKIIDTTPDRDKKFSLRRLIKEDGLTKKKSNYVLSYTNKNDTKIELYLKISEWQRFRLRWQMTDNILSSKVFLTEVFKYLITAIIGALVTYIFTRN